MPKAGLYSIGAIARMTGVPVATLRTWEDRYGLVIAARSAGGQRRYSRGQLEQLIFVAERVRDGLSPGDAHRLLAERGAGVVMEPADAAESIGILVLIAERDPSRRELSGLLPPNGGVPGGGRLGRRGGRAPVRPARAAAGDRRADAVGGPRRRAHRAAHASGALVVAISPLAAGDISAALGADAFLQKPVDPVVLLSTVRDLLGTSALTQARVRSPA